MGGGYLPWLVDGGVPTLDGGYLPWLVDGRYLPMMEGTYPGQGVPQGRYSPSQVWMGGYPKEGTPSQGRYPWPGQDRGHTLR